jgi:hypothetical protein
MKTIEVSDKDYETLMELSKELLIQDNNSQAFPYFWEPSSYKLKHDVNDEGEVKEIYLDGETYSLEGFAEAYDEDWEEFVKENELEDDGYDNSLEYEWEEFITDKYWDARAYSSNWKRETEHNPSLFMSDVKGFIEYNQHHLGKDPHTYSRSIWRMPKMEKLVSCLLRLNSNVPEECINHEALVYKKKGE